MRWAYHAPSAAAAEAELTGAGRRAGQDSSWCRGPDLREAWDETLTVLRLGVPPTLARTLWSTNAVERVISICREHISNIKRWRRADGAALVRGHGRGRQAVPPRQRSLAPQRAAYRARPACGRRDRHRTRSQRNRDRSLTIAGPLPTFHPMGNARQRFGSGEPTLARSWRGSSFWPQHADLSDSDHRVGRAVRPVRKTVPVVLTSGWSTAR